MSPRHRSSQPSRWLAQTAVFCDQARLLLLSAALVALPLALGGRATWVLPAAVLVNAVGLALLFVEKACSGERIRRHWGWAVAAVLILIPAAQLIPSEFLTSVFSSEAAAIWERARGAGFTDLQSRLSLAPVRTWNALWMLTQILLAAFLIYNTFATRARLLALSACLAGAAVINAGAALIPIVLDAQPLFADLGIGSKPLSGTFENRNHFAFLMALGLVQLAAIAWVVQQSATDAEGGRTKSFTLDRQLAAKRGPILLACALAAVFVSMSLLLSLSRGGAFAALVGLLAFLGLALRRTDAMRRWKWVLSAALLGGAILVGSMEALLGLWGRYEGLMKLGNLGLLGRWNVWGETAELIGRFPLTGVGLNAFEPSSPMVESGFVPGRISFHAHNDYLELLSEVGLPLGILILAAIGIAYVLLWRRVLRTRDTLAQVLGLASLCGLLAVAVHEMVEYNLRSPANGFLVAAMAVLALLASEIQTERQRKDRPNAGARPRRAPPQQTGLVRGGLLTSAVLIAAGALWVVPPRIAAGLRVTGLRAVAASADELPNTGQARLTQAKYFLDETGRVLQVLPRNERALYYRAIYQQILASIRSENVAGRDSSMEERRAVVREVLESREAARRLCRYSPTDGAYQALFAKQLNLSAWYDEKVSIPAIIRAFEVAHASYPNVPQVTWRCIQAFGEILRVDRDELNSAELERLEKKLARMGRSLLETQPGKAADVLPVLHDVFGDGPRLIEATPRRLLCYEPLYKLFFRQGKYERCSALLDTMKQINAERVTRDDAEEVSLYELTRTHPASRQEMVARLVHKELALASVSGDWDAYAALRGAEHQARRKLCLTELKEAQAAASAGNIHKALRMGRALLGRFPSIADGRASVADWLVTIGEYDAALDCLLPLMWLEPLSPDVIRLALPVCRDLVADERFSRYAKLLVNVLTVRHAALEADAPVPGLEAAFLPLESWATPAHSQPNRSRFTHLALHYAGRGQEIRGKPKLARDLYHRALERCPLHRRSIQRILALAPTADNTRGDLQNRLQDLHLDPAWLQRDLIDIHESITLRNIRFSTQTLGPAETVTLSALLEVTDDLLSLPDLHMQFQSADGATFKRRIDLTTKDDRQQAGTLTRVGRLLMVTDTFNPSVAALRRQTVLEPGPVVLRIKGKGRDRGFTLYLPAFSVQDQAP